MLFAELAWFLDYGVFMKLFLVFFQLFIVYSWAAEARNMAVLDLDGTANLTMEETKTISDRLESEIQGTGKASLLERRKMQEILSEQGFQQSGACDASNCQVQVGQLLGVDQVITGSVGKVGNVYTLNVKLIDVQTGAILRSHVVDVEGDLSKLLVYGCKESAQGLLGLETKETLPKERSGSWKVWGGVGVVALATIGGIVYYLFQPAETTTKTVVISRDRVLQ